ncbi:MAG: hypothetical protein AB7O26_08795 [Planctomycetaceae bacterium]
MQSIDNKSRQASRGAFCEVVWLIPIDEQTRRPDFNRVATLVTRDISSDGMALVHNEPVRDKRVIVGLQDDTCPRFIDCDLQHCTSLGYGHYVIGLHPNEVVQLEPYEVEALEERLRHAEQPVLA